MVSRIFTMRFGVAGSLGNYANQGVSQASRATQAGGPPQNRYYITLGSFCTESCLQEDKMLVSVLTDDGPRIPGLKFHISTTIYIYLITHE